MKYLFFVFLFLACQDKQVKNEKQPFVLEVDREHRNCKETSDCVLTMTHCSCHCGIPINKEFKDLYQKKKDKMCENYNGRYCKKNCSDVKLICYDDGLGGGGGCEYEAIFD